MKKNKWSHTHLHENISSAQGVTIQFCDFSNRDPDKHMMFQIPGW